ncbi:MAG: hypothetical protein NTZ95_04055 [Candidatus Omnitrophica bacterium]|nr:hypothetical protein [Candidatus Omnitrophota bacterium]
MMNINRIFILVAAFAVVTVMIGCGSLETYGGKISSRNMTAIKDIVMHPQDYTDKTVTVRGTIRLVCETGCWFNLEDKGATIYTDLGPSGFAIPQKVGRNATVEGKISIESGKLTLTGKAVEIR